MATGASLGTRRRRSRPAAGNYAHRLRRALTVPEPAWTLRGVATTCAFPTTRQRARGLKARAKEGGVVQVELRGDDSAAQVCGLVGPGAG